MTIPHYVQIKGRHAIHFAHESRTGKKAAAIHLPVRILGIDPGVRCGFASINAQDWDNKLLKIDYLAYVDVSDPNEYPDDIKRIRLVGAGLEEIMKITDPMAMGIELPVVARAPNKSTILQARMFQHLVDRSAGLYHIGFSEIHPATSRAAVLKRGDIKKGQTKANVIHRVEERFGIYLGDIEDRLMREALADAVTVALAFINSVPNIK